MFVVQHSVRLTHAARSPDVRQHIQTTRGLFPHKRVIRKSEMTSKGLVVTEVQEDIEPGTLPTPAVKEEDPAVKRSPIGELLYMRWLEGLKLRWPLSST